MDGTNVEAQREITPELGSGERLLWSGRPYQGVIFRPHDVFMIPFSVLWTGFMVAFFVAMIWNTRGRSAAPADAGGIAISVLFLVFGLYVTFGRFMVDIRQRRKTFYGVTNHRVIIIRGILQRGIKSIDLRSMSGLTLFERPDRSGTIRFGDSEALWWLSGGELLAPGASMANAFERIPNARAVYELIRSAQGSPA